MFFVKGGILGYETNNPNLCGAQPPRLCRTKSGFRLQIECHLPLRRAGPSFHICRHHDGGFAEFAFPGAPGVNPNPTCAAPPANAGRNVSQNPGVLAALVALPIAEFAPPSEVAY